jgi:anaerobic ribonucleoside-triphosphate reductase activating protein
MSFTSTSGGRAATLWFSPLPFYDSRHTPERVAGEILGVCESERLDGVTFSGGEPMQQAPALVALMRELRAGPPGFSLGLFTGYTERELDQGHFHCVPERSRQERLDVWREVRHQLDFAIMGRYNGLQPSSDGLCSSQNQRLRLFSTRHQESDFGTAIAEVTIGSDGLAQFTGFPVHGIPA